MSNMNEHNEDVREKIICYPNSVIMLQHCFLNKKGKLDGEFRKWYYNSQLETQCSYKDGNFEGEFKSWYKSSRPKKHWYFKNGKLHGKCISWSYDGDPIEQCLYKDGKLDGVKKWWYIEEGTLHLGGYDIYKDGYKICKVTPSILAVSRRLKRKMRRRYFDIIYSCDVNKDIAIRYLV